ncbi:hypothetical protein BaRGS_00027244, partial [Batillaria attramentaria]
MEAATRPPLAVVIPAGKRVLLNVQPPTLSTLTIPAGSALIWDHVDNIVLRTQYVLVHGEFLVGSRLCRFRKQATIQLYGLSNSTHYVDGIGRKFIGVAEGGTLSLQGKRKTSWTRLAQTVKPLSDIDCGTVYDHSDHEKNPFAKERQNGLHVLVWNKDGSVFDFNVFKSFNNFREFFETVPSGNIIAMYAFGTPGVGKRKSKLGFDTLDAVVHELGGKLISKVNKYDSYSLITRKGSPLQTLEHYKPRGQVDQDPEGFLRCTDWIRHLDFQYFRVLSTDAAFPLLHLAENVIAWSIGEKVLVTSTDYDWRQAEVREIFRCPECKENQIRVNETFRFMHYGNITHNVDERAEVGMLTNSILVEGVMEDECYANSEKEQMLCDYFGKDTFGGHIKALRGHASVEVVNVELYHMGQQVVTGAYPLHFHMCDDASGSRFAENSIHHSFSRCITIHGTDQVEVSGNLCYDHLGHGFFLEDGVEQNNVIDSNVGVGTQHGTLLMSDMRRHWCAADPALKRFEINCDELSTFWITHPNNELTNNVAAGSDGHGFMIVFADLPLTSSYERQKELGKVPPYSVKYHPFKKFIKNVGHSNYKTGLFMDSKISTGRLPKEEGVPENGVLQTESLYDPRSPPNDTGTRVWTTMKRLNFYKNNRGNLWLKGGNVRVVQASLADAPEGFTGGNTGTDTGTEIVNSVFIGQSDNLGLPRLYNYDVDKRTTLSHQFNQSFAGLPFDSLTGVAFYQGPMFVKNCFFDRYVTWFWDDSWAEDFGSRPVRPAGAISWKRANTYPTMTNTWVHNVTFGYCDNEGDSHWVFHGNASTYGWEEKDGNLAAFVRDMDGSLTGSPGSALVRNFPLYKGDECLDRPDWGMSVCPYRYIKVSVKVFPSQGYIKVSVKVFPSQGYIKVSVKVFPSQGYIKVSVKVFASQGYIKMEILGSGGNLAKGKNEKHPLVIQRDDAPYDVPFSVPGQIRREFLLRTHRSYILDFNNTTPGAAFPNEVLIFGYNIERGDVVRVGMCMPLDVESFDIRSEYPVLLKNGNATMVSTLRDLDRDTTGGAILFFKLQSDSSRSNQTERCPGGECVRFKIRLEGGNLAAI